VQNQINSLGSNLIIVLPGSVTQSGARTGSGGASTLTPQDAIADRRVTGRLSRHAGGDGPHAGRRRGRKLADDDQRRRATYTYVRQWALAEGTFFSDADVASAAKVCVLGQTVSTNLFGTTNPIGRPCDQERALHDRGHALRARSKQRRAGQDDTVIVPYTSALQRLTGGTFVNELMVSGTTQADTSGVQTEITSLLEQRHRITNGQDDFQGA